MIENNDLYERAWEFFLISLHEFIERDRDLIQTAVSERSLCARLMLSMEMLKRHYGFDPYVVDVEYNRIGQGDVKRLHADGGGITADLVMHRRTFTDNLIALEMKWFSQTRDYERKKAADYERLSTFTRRDGGDGSLPRGYVLGLHVEVRRHEGIMCIERFHEGMYDEGLVLTDF